MHFITHLHLKSLFIKVKKNLSREDLLMRTSGSWVLFILTRDAVGELDHCFGSSRGPLVGLGPKDISVMFKSYFSLVVVYFF